MSKKEFRTDQLAVCPYLLLNDLKYLRAEITLGKYDRSVVVFVFEDEHGIGKDLELDFARSDFKKYRDTLFFFRNEIEKLMRKVDRINLKELRKDDDKYISENEDVKEGYIWALKIEGLGYGVIREVQGRLQTQNITILLTHSESLAGSQVRLNKLRMMQMSMPFLMTPL